MQIPDVFEDLKRHDYRGGRSFERYRFSCRDSDRRRAIDVASHIYRATRLEQATIRHVAAPHVHDDVAWTNVQQGVDRYFDLPSQSHETVPLMIPPRRICARMRRHLPAQV
jgi:hypothetical protein